MYKTTTKHSYSEKSIMLALNNEKMHDNSQNNASIWEWLYTDRAHVPTMLIKLYLSKLYHTYITEFCDYCLEKFSYTNETN